MFTTAELRGNTAIRRYEGYDECVVSPATTREEAILAAAKHAIKNRRKTTIESINGIGFTIDGSSPGAEGRIVNEASSEILGALAVLGPAIEEYDGRLVAYYRARANGEVAVPPQDPDFHIHWPGAQ